MNKKQHKRLLRQAIKEHSIADYARALLTPEYLQAMKEVGSRRLCSRKQLRSK